MKSMYKNKRFIWVVLAIVIITGVLGFLPIWEGRCHRYDGGPLVPYCTKGNNFWNSRILNGVKLLPSIGEFGDIYR